MEGDEGPVNVYFLEQIYADLPNDVNAALIIELKGSQVFKLLKKFVIFGRRYCFCVEVGVPGNSCVIFYCRRIDAG